MKTAAKLQFWEYGTTRKSDKSGAYLFLPGESYTLGWVPSSLDTLDGPGKVRTLARQTVKVVEGKLRSCVTVTDSWIRHVVCLHNSPGVDGTGLHIENDIDLTSQTMNNREIAMKISSDIQSEDLFYTDLNGFQVGIFFSPKLTTCNSCSDDPKEALREASYPGELLPGGLHGVHPGQVQSPLPNLRPAARRY